MRFFIRVAGLATLWLASFAAAQFVFEDVTRQLGLAEPLARWRYAHGIAAGDVTGNGLPDLYVGAFADRQIFAAPGAPLPNILFLNEGGRFTPAPESEISLKGRRARTTMALFADLNNNGWLDLIVGNHANRGNSYRSGIYENMGGGRFRDATPTPPAWLARAQPRNISVLDFDRDGLLDLIVTDGTYGAHQSGRGRLSILRNNGDWTFTDVSAKFGFPAGNTTGLGTTLGDVNNDGILDIFVAHENRLFVSGPDGRYRLFDDRGVFVKANFAEYWPCGVAFGDLTGNDLLDLVITVHEDGGGLFVYQNTGIRDGMPQFRQIMKVEFPRRGFGTDWRVKNGHVALRDMDNDGRLDIVLGVIYADEQGRPAPFVMRNLGNDRNGVPQFARPPAERAMGYYAAASLVDLERDGRLDLILPAWPEEMPHIAFRNVTPGGNWLLVQVQGARPGFNRMGIGAIVRAFPAGAAGKAVAPLARYDLSIGNGYSSGEEAIAHLGLGAATTCDLVIDWQGVRKVLPNVPVNRLMTVEFGPEG